MKKDSLNYISAERSETVLLLLYERSSRELKEGLRKEAKDLPASEEDKRTNTLLNSDGHSNLVRLTKEGIEPCPFLIE